MQLSASARYFPIARGVYEVTAGLKPLGADFGNGAMDGRVFQIDTDFPRFRQSKLACRAEGIGKYYQQANLSAVAASTVVGWMVDRLMVEYPEIFRIDGDRMYCGHTDEEIALTGDPLSTFDALVNQVAEDVCLMRVEGDRNWLAAAHVCSPSHWAVGDKIGKPFTAIHDPVPGIDAINQKSHQFADMMVHRGPFVRFAWGIGTDGRLNHHPQPPPGVDPDDWRGRRFDLKKPVFFLRVERQVTWGLPEINAAVFTIRISHVDGQEIRSNPAERDRLISAIESMTDESRRYKGIGSSADAIVEWLSNNRESA